MVLRRLGTVLLNHTNTSSLFQIQMNSTILLIMWNMINTMFQVQKGRNSTILLIMWNILDTMFQVQKNKNSTILLIMWNSVKYKLTVPDSEDQEQYYPTHHVEQC